MWIVKNIVLFFICFLLTPALSFAKGNSLPEVLVLKEDWMFSQAGTEAWMPATVPGTVHRDLIRQGKLPDPFYGMNEREIQWVENEDWEYTVSFSITEDQLNRDAALLSFEGIDTYADIYLNGALLLKSDNMFVGYSVPVKNILRKGVNTLRVYFHSPIKQTLPQWASNGFDYPADNDHHEKRLSVFTRKAPYSYGWDWGIRMVTSGFWRPVTLRFYDVVTIEDYYVKQISLTDEEAETAHVLTLNGASDMEGPVDIVVSYSLEGGRETSVRQKIDLVPGENRVLVPVTVPKPVRWMPNGWGKATLYDFSARVFAKGKLVAEQKHRIGFRTVRLVSEKDDKGESFFFEVNGIPLFAKGANYIPSDALLPDMTTERYQILFQDIKDANMNMVRVWGGGTYEDDRFYDLADENGILVWQDFMFACTTYPSDPVFLKRVAEEADYNIKRLRNHASLALWTGNNEILEGIKYWGWNKKYSPDVYEEMMRGYDKIFRELLPEKVKELDPGRSYKHGSPDVANWGRPETWGTGDSHNWGVWYGKKEFSSLDTELPRFMSEFGFQSFPEMKTIATFSSPEDYRIDSDVMNAHQKSSIGNALIRTYMERDYIVPEKFEDFVYINLVLQGRGIRHGLEAHRRNRPYTMGSLYWQLNDSWPVVSWSGIDYYGNWKALHYQARRAFAPLLLNPLQDGENLDIYVISDQLEGLNDLTLDIDVSDFEGKILYQETLHSVSSPSNSSVLLYRKGVDALVEQGKRAEVFLKMTLKDKSGNVLAENVHFFNRTKNLALPKTTISSDIIQDDGRVEITLRSEKLAKDIFIQVPIQGVRFSDNFFDLLPEEEKKVVITSPLIKKDVPLQISVRHVRETYD